MTKQLSAAAITRLANEKFDLIVHFTLSGAAQVWASGPWKKGSPPQVSPDLLSHCLVYHYFRIQIQFSGSSSCRYALLELLSPLTSPCHCSRPGCLSPASCDCRLFRASAHPHRLSLGSWVCVPLGLPML